MGVPHDGSFLLDTEPPYRELVSSSGLVLSQGLYESFFLRELIPYVESTYSVLSTRRGRYIGGYSMGGYAALRIALTHPTLFSRVGAHSPTLYVDALPDATVTQFMYPDTETRKQRDPLQMAVDCGSVLDTEFYIDTGPADINRPACELMYARLQDCGASVEYQVLPGSHGAAYLWTHMPAYLGFYGG